MADVVLPNSRSEATQLMRLFGLSAESHPRRAQRRAARDRLGDVRKFFCAAFGTFPFVLSVGRIEPRKNTLGLIRAARRLELPLVIVGEAPPGLRAVRGRVPAGRR